VTARAPTHHSSGPARKAAQAAQFVSVSRMKTETLTFERIFDLLKTADRGGRYALFGFESAGARRYGVRIDGWPDMEEGMTVTAVVRNDWQVIFGWINHSNNQIHFEGIGRSLVVLLATIFMGGVLFFSSQRLDWDKTHWLLLFFVCIVALEVLFLRERWGAWRLLRRLTLRSSGTAE
jgi:hypothetical protein